MLNKTSINPEVVRKVLKACTESLKVEGGQVYINNRKGVPFIRVKKVIKKDGLIGFQVLDKSNKNIANLLIDSIINDSIGNNSKGFALTTGLKIFLLKRVAFSYELH